ncbi:MAG: D-aminoacyl-tRNA deacylase [Schleiferilactobacillus harbinensis]|jgi:D-tyrosyl-tRNA(Tyr) deacylase|uniref:D-aminoacyl-tRNA deacylase n=1 Tax=Schleiferilactobacillus perolens TaxID=100468 RepID=UPI00070B0A95|nr:D-aminoacyl-tRNA deacylase [Schleiferilactobacillus perolens]MCI1891708.1 D-aminoacyl-tRNA deacylase [Schleiferilactobacillus harbinensis]MCI1912054.1 D-aminoacyl-tRNA deacylase [Schleiferilactobacillus harbinensis]
MRIVVQRVSEAAVAIADKTVGTIGRGFMILVGVGPTDTQRDVDYLVRKVAKLRVFSDDQGKMNLDLAAVNGQVLSISQFTLYADTAHGNRPGFSQAASPELGQRLYESFNDGLRQAGITVATGEFGADMAVSLINDGPVTILYDTEEEGR